MRVLVVGGDSKEHAIYRRLRESGRFSKLYYAPNNAGIAEVVELVPIGVMELEKTWDFTLREGINPVVIGMDDPLVSGPADFLGRAGLKVPGPKKNAAILKGSKAFAEELMEEYEIPTAAYESFMDYEAAKCYLETCKVPVVLKADGPALGKGVLICETREAAEEDLKEMMLEWKFGASGDKVVIEEFMMGRGVLVLSFVDGKTIHIVASMQDHKKVGDGDQSLNMDGTGSCLPSLYYADEIARLCKEKIYQRTVGTTATEGRPFQGVIFFGLMLAPDGPRVLEYNVRFSDPEVQVAFPRMESDLPEAMSIYVGGKLDEVQLKFCDKACVTVVLTGEGYPVKYEKGLPILGLESLEGEPDVYYYHADTRFDDEGRVIADGDRVLDVTTLGKTIRGVRERAYVAAKEISFANEYTRTDIALTGVAVRETQQA